MFAPRRMRQKIRSILAFLALLLMIASFIWMERTSKPAPKARPRAAQQPSPSPKPFAVVVLDPGHGGQDSGAMWGGVLEKELSLGVARRIHRLLVGGGIATAMETPGGTV